MVEELNTICLKEYGSMALQHPELRRSGQTTRYSSESYLKMPPTVFMGEYCIHCSQIRYYFGLRGQVLNWIHSFVTSRTQSVVSLELSLSVVSYPLWCTTRKHPWTVSLYFLCRRHHCCDMAPRCTPTTESYERRLPRFTECIAAIEGWMTANWLKMNSD